MSRTFGDTCMPGASFGASIVPSRWYTSGPEIASWRFAAPVVTVVVVSGKGESRFSWLTLVPLAFKGLCIGLMIATPLAGVWLASSLAAFANRATWLPVAAGALLFPGLPLAWEGWAVWRAKQAKRKRKRFLTFSDRLILRTLLLNFVFLAVLVAAFPERAFIALSARGDWMLDGHHGPTAEKMRSGLLAAAGGLEWVYKAAHDNPYRDEQAKTDTDTTPKPTPTPNPIPRPVATATATATATTTSSATPVASTSSSSEVPPPLPPPTPPGAGIPYPLAAQVHPIIRSIPPEAEATIEGVGRYIAAHESDPVQRVKALHDYVADRVAYDAPAYAAHHIPHEDGDAHAVFASHKGVCAGYAQLLAALGRVTGDEIVYVVGDARSKRSPMEGEGHAWNAAKVNGNWYLIDPTWDAGYVDGTQFTKKYSTEYLFTPADLFAISHYPDQSKWQLLEQPLSHAEFFRRPVLAPAFFASHLKLVTPDRSQVSAAGRLDIQLENPSGAFLLADFAPKAGGNKVECKGDAHAQFHCDFPAAGTYDVRLYVNHERYGTYAYAGGVEVNSR